MERQVIDFRIAAAVGKAVGLVEGVEPDHRVLVIGHGAPGYGRPDQVNGSLLRRQFGNELLISDPIRRRFNRRAVGLIEQIGLIQHQQILYLRMAQDKAFHPGKIVGAIAAPEHGKEFHLVSLMVTGRRAGLEIPVIPPTDTVFQCLEIFRSG